jgi:PIN domain nuclease of toxin-antitoxin system
VGATRVFSARRPLLHKDPFDRILVAQAKLEDMILLTPDAVIAKYGVRTAW